MAEENQTDFIPRSDLPEKREEDLSLHKRTVRCKGRIGKKGETRQCKNFTLYEDFPYCGYHGRDAIKYAKKVLDGLSISAVNVYDELLNRNDNPPCPLCGAGGMITPLKLKAAEGVMDRVGLGPTLKVEHSGAIAHDILVEKMTEEEFSVVDEIMRRVMARAEAEKISEEAALTE